eukprot:CAMPEP_0119048732 /NCGR_PEP_ID=MMETSP1177-20130426/60719_1 /TAXON_ID=2985 /ORGANISM="Ochromonas sp, Strain CCMP1899" /LENGTH=106 /DNA_ID=CAMNT_0007025043 /DNA_START=317 /DNA_END=638 /DNA_ORIENTATION=+
MTIFQQEVYGICPFFNKMPLSYGITSVTSNSGLVGTSNCLGVGVEVGLGLWGVITGEGFKVTIPQLFRLNIASLGLPGVTGVEGKSEAKVTLLGIGYSEVDMDELG